MAHCRRRESIAKVREASRACSRERRGWGDGYETRRHSARYVIFSDPDQMDTYLRDNLKSHRVIKGKDWDAMSDEQKKTAIDNLKKNNPNNYYIDLRTGDICSFAGESALRGAFVRSDSDLGGRLVIPDGILTDEEKSERTRLQMEDLKRRASQPPENPGHASADLDHD